jgi:hypothetical protein
MEFEEPSFEELKESMIKNAPIATQKFLVNCKNQQKCVRCKRSFSPITTLGRWECSFHRSPLNMFAYPKPVYTCCGKEQGSKGCTACDHHETQEIIDHTDSILVADNMANIFGQSAFERIPDKSISKEGGKLYIIRFDDSYLLPNY